jgi:hypothetical protein
MLETKLNYEWAIRLIRETYQAALDGYPEVMKDSLGAFTTWANVALLGYPDRGTTDDDVVSERVRTPSDRSPSAVLGASGFQIARSHQLVWRDHPYSFAVNVAGFPVLDFQAHTHDVEVPARSSAHCIPDGLRSGSGDRGCRKA